ncbi:MAG: MFS transporter [Actinomycetota bacterium]
MAGTQHGATRLFTVQFVILGVSTALYNGAFGALNALLPRYVVDVLGGGESTAGFVMGTMAITALLARPWLGRVADRSGARRIIIVGAAVAATGIPLLTLGDSIALTVAARLVMGIGNAGVFTGSTLLALTLAPEARRAEAAAYILVTVHVGIGLGPIAGERLRDAMSYDASWWLVTAMMAGAALAACFLVDRPGDADPDAPPAPLVSRSALLPGAVSLFGVFAFNGLLTFVPLYSREIGLDDAAFVFTVASGTIIVMRLAFGRVPDRIGPVRAASGALVITAIAAAVVALWAEPVGLYVGASLLAVGLSLQSPSFMSITVARAPERERGSAMATFTGFFDIANAIVGPSIGLIVAGVGYQTAFLFSGSMAVVALVLLRVFLSDHPGGRITMPIAGSSPRPVPR